MKTVTGSETTAYTNTVTSGRKYYYKVRAIKYTDESCKKYVGQVSNVKYGTATLIAPPMKSVTKYSSTKTKITWKKVTGATGYYVYRSTREKTGFKKLATVKGKTSYVTNASKGKYYYKVKAFREVNGKVISVGKAKLKGLK